ncbi:MAG: hypothetical protein ACOYJB_03155 [Christensenellaceae bacterium]
MKKIFCIVLAAFLCVFAFAGCGNTEPASEASPEPSASESAQTPAPTESAPAPPAEEEPPETANETEEAQEVTQEQMDGIMYALGHYLMYDVALEGWPENRDFDETTELDFAYFEEIFQNVIWMSYGTPGSYYYQYSPDDETFGLVDLSGATTFGSIADRPVIDDVLGLMENHTADEGLGRGVFLLTEDAAKKAMYSMFGQQRVDSVQFFETVTGYSSMEETDWYWYEDGYFLIAGTRPYEVGGTVTPKTTDYTFEEGKEYTFSWKADLNEAYDGSEGIFVTETDIVVTLVPDAESNYGYNFQSFAGDNPGMNAGAVE